MVLSEKTTSTWKKYIISVITIIGTIMLPINALQKSSPVKFTFYFSCLLLLVQFMAQKLSNCTGSHPNDSQTSLAFDFTL